MFLAAFFLGRTFSGVFTFLALVPSMVLHGAVWRLGTYMFLHGSVLAFVFNMLQLWMFGRELEGILGHHAIRPVLLRAAAARGCW